jgi:LysM repeat protein
MYDLLKLAAALAVVGVNTGTARATSPRTTCDTAALNSTVGSYTVSSGDTIFTVATTTNRGVCDIARYNRMADATILNAGEVLTIPAQVCHPDQSTCLLVDTKPTRKCVLGGPHTYLTWPNDTIASIATTKFNITVDSLWNTTSRMLSVADAYSVIPTGNNIKLPLCNVSQCIVQPYEFLFGTYKDVAEQLGTTPGQLMAFNPGYNHSGYSATAGPIIAGPMKCELLTADYTVVS